jgi:hypothetical protein
MLLHLAVVGVALLAQRLPLWRPAEVAEVVAEQDAQQE